MSEDFLTLDYSESAFQFGNNMRMRGEGQGAVLQKACAH